MKSRHRSREIALQILYQYDLTHSVEQETKPKIISPVGVPDSPVSIGSPGSKEVIGQLQKHFEHFNVPETLQEFIAQLVAGTLSQKTEIDALLEKHAAHWKVARMSSVDRSILRMATYEILYLKETPPSVVIDEAIVLAKQFGTAETASFINGILDSIKK